MQKEMILMVCTAARGGMKSVVEGYRQDGLFDKWNIRLISPHAEGSVFLRLSMALKAYIKFVYYLIFCKVSLVHCHSAMKGSFWRKSLFALTARALGVPVLFHLHGSEMKTFYSMQPVILQRLIKWILSRQTKVIVLSKSWLDFVKSVSPKANVEILSNYVDLPDETGLNSDYRAHKCIKILFLGFLGSRKGLYDLLPAFKQLIEQECDVELILGGNGEVDKLKALAKQLNIENHVNFAGWVSGDTKLNLLHQADLFVLPSYNEGLPMSLLEAMSYKLPVITTNVGGIPELVRDGVDGLLFEPGDVAALARHMTYLVEYPEIRTQMANACRMNVENNFSKKVIFPKLNQLYQENIKS